MTIPMRRDFVQRLTPVVLAQVAGLACGIIGIKLTSRFVPPDALGQYGVFMSFTTIGMWVVHAGLIKYVSRHWAAESDKPALFRQMLRLWRAKLPWLVGAAVAATIAILSLTTQVSVIVFIPLLVCAAALSLAAMGTTALQVNREHWRDCAISASGSVTRTFLPLGCFLLIGAQGLYAGLTLHTLVGLGLVAWVFRAHWRVRPSPKPLDVAPVYLGPAFTLIALSDWALSGVNRWIVAGNFGSVEAGFFTLAGNIAVILPIFAGTVLKQLFQPSLFALGDRHNPGALQQLLARVDQVAAIFAALAVVGVLVLHLIMPWLVGPLVDQRYGAALPWIVPAGFFSVAIITGQFYHLLLLAAKRESHCAVVDLTGAGVLIGGGAITALWHQDAFRWWLLVTPVLPWLINRPLARYRCQQASPSG